MARAVEVERTLDTDQQLVRGAEMHGAAPNDAAAFAGHNTLHCRNVELHGGKGFHYIGRTGRRGNGPRGGLWDRQAGGGDNGNHKRRCAVARQAADRVLVYDRSRVPVELIADPDHRSCERNHLVLGHGPRRTGCDESGQLNVGIAAMDDIIEYCRQSRSAELFPINFASNMTHGLERFRMRNTQQLTVRDS